VTARRLLLLDLDGTLVDSFEDIEHGLRAAHVAVGLKTDHDVRALVLSGAPLEEHWHAATGRPPTDDLERYHAFARAYREHYWPRCLATTRPYPGVADTLRALRARRRPPVVAVATAKRTETARRVLEGTGLAELVDVVAGSEDIPGKPDPAVIHRASERAGTSLDGALMLGDTERDLHAARAAGVRAGAVTYGGRTAAELARHAPDVLIDRFEELLAHVDDA
jgi:phosphoglycolate phosphatase